MTLSRVKRPYRHLNMRLWFEKLILVVFVIGSHLTCGKYEAEVQQFINSLTTTYCPYTDLCQSNASQLLKKKTSPCCDDCSCANDCWKKGNCCPDKHNATKQSPTTVCQTTLVKGTSDHDNFDKYWVVKKCPETTSNATVAKKCKGKSLKSIKDYLWVSDPVTSRIYNNKWCADCYNVTKFVEWRASTECVQILNGKNLIDEKGSLNNECNLIVVPPEGIDAANELCRKPDISKCNKTGQWMEYNDTLEKACEAFELLFYEEHLFGQTVYKNVFCAMCNEPYKRPKDVGRVCKPRVLRERTGHGGRFFGLIDGRFYKQPKSRGDVCALDEVEDKFMVGFLILIILK